MSTANNDEFLRFWHEVSIQNIGFGCKDREEASNSLKNGSLMPKVVAIESGTAIMITLLIGRMMEKK